VDNPYRNGFRSHTGLFLSQSRFYTFHSLCNFVPVELIELLGTLSFIFLELVYCLLKDMAELTAKYILVSNSASKLHAKE